MQSPNAASQADSSLVAAPPQTAYATGWRTWPALAVALAGLAGIVITALIAIALLGVDTVEKWFLDDSQPTIRNVAETVVAVASATAIVFTADRLHHLRSLKLARVTLKTLGSSALVGAILATPPAAVWLLDEGLPHMPDVLTLAALFSASVIAVPFLEELFFRGILLGWLAQRLPFSMAALASSVAFAAIHPVGTWLFATLAGLLMAYFLRSTNSLYPGFVLHGAFNLTLLLARGGDI